MQIYCCDSIQVLRSFAFVDISWWLLNHFSMTSEIEEGKSFKKRAQGSFGDPMTAEGGLSKPELLFNDAPKSRE